ncbi:MAG: hypothetical protein AAF694_21875 [Bacteroidota bacterium]
MIPKFIIQTFFLFLFGNSLGAFAQEYPIHLSVEKFFYAHTGTLDQLLPQLGEGLFMRYPPPQDSILKHTIRVKFEGTSLPWEKGKEVLHSPKNLHTLIGKSQKEIRYSTWEKVIPRGTESHRVQLKGMEPFAILRKRPGRAKYSVAAIGIGDNFELTEPNPMGETCFLIHTQVCYGRQDIPLSTSVFILITY